MYKYDAIKLNQNSLGDSVKMLNDYPPPWECFAIDNGIAYFRKLTKPIEIANPVTGETMTDDRITEFFDKYIDTPELEHKIISIIERAVSV